MGRGRRLDQAQRQDDLTGAEEHVTAQIKYKDTEETFSGRPEQVWLLINRFFTQCIPTFEIAQKLILKADMQELARNYEGIIAFSKEGSNILIPRDRLTDNETLLLWLLAGHIGSHLGINATDTVSKEELQAKLGKNPKIASTRLGELVKNSMASKTTDEKYRITTFGIVQAQKEMLPKIRARLGT